MTLEPDVRETDAMPNVFRRKLRLGFNTRVPFNSADGPARGLRDGISLYKAAEQLGYQSGWAYQRHFDNYLSSPLPFFAAAGQHTSRITLGSAVIPMRYQDPILLAEAAGTTDLLIGERLELAIATGGNAEFDSIFGAVETDARTEAKRRQARFLAAISGAPVNRSNDAAQEDAAGVELRVTPHSPALRQRIRQGASSIGSSIQAAELGLGLILGTVQHGFDPGESFGHYLARCIAAYRSKWRELYGTEAPPVAVAASILPATAQALRETYAAYDHERRTLGIAASRPQGALEPGNRANRPAGSQISPVFHGTPDQVIEAVRSCPGLAAADELVLFLPPAFDLGQNCRLLEDMVRTVAPHLDWEPAGSA